jgi:transcriptional regulator with XRE-family HTH domain
VPDQTSTILERIGRRVAELREERGWRQIDLADRMGWESARQLQEIEGGRENLSVLSLVDLANALEVEPGELFVMPAQTTRRGPGRPKRTTVSD